MNPVDLAQLLLTRGTVDMILRPGNDLTKMMNIKYIKDDGQLFFTLWDPSIKLDFVLPSPEIVLTSDLVSDIFTNVLNKFYIIDQPNLFSRGGAKAKSKATAKAKSKVGLSYEQEKVGKKLTSTQIAKLAECLPLAIKGVKITKPLCIEKPKLSDIKTMLQLGVSPNYEFQPEFFDKESKKVVKKTKQSVLQYALSHDRLDIAKLLIESGANVNYIINSSSGKKSLLHYVIELSTKNTNAIELLLEAGADINSQVYPGSQTPLHVALSIFKNKTATDIKHTLNVIKLFLKNKTKPNLFLKTNIKIKGIKEPISSTIVQSAKFLVKKLDNKYQSSKIVSELETYISKLSVEERLQSVPVA